MQPDKSSKKVRASRTLRFDDTEQVRGIHRAAATLGMSFNAFVVHAARDAAKLVNSARREKRPTLGTRAGENLLLAQSAPSVDARS